MTFSRSGRAIGLFGVGLALALMGLPQTANGQVWLQTARLVAPVEQGPVRTLLDSVATVMERRGLRARRSPEPDTGRTVTALRRQLIDEEGVGIRSANHVFVDYRFALDSGSSFRQQITSLHFVFRPGPTQADVPILYLDAQENWVRELLRNKGTSLPTNEAALIPFRRHLGFADIARRDETQIVEISGETVREGFREKKDALIRKVEWLTYDTFG